MTVTRKMDGTLILTRSMLAKIRSRAMRRGVWFRILNSLERATISLTMRVVEKVRSSVLTKTLAFIIKKLRESMESRVARMMREVGYDLAQKMSTIAQRWGNRSARRWPEDSGFLQYLAIMYMERPP